VEPEVKFIKKQAKIRTADVPGLLCIVSLLASLVEFNRSGENEKRNSRPSIRKEASNPGPVIPDKAQEKLLQDSSQPLTDSSLEQGLLGMLPGEKINEFWERRKKDSKALLHRIKVRLSSWSVCPAKQWVQSMTRS
jgi:hypothetical protein